MLCCLLLQGREPWLGGPPWGDHDDICIVLMDFDDYLIDEWNQWKRVQKADGPAGHECIPQKTMVDPCSIAVTTALLVVCRGKHIHPCSAPKMAEKTKDLVVK